MKNNIKKCLLFTVLFTCFCSIQSVFAFSNPDTTPTKGTGNVIENNIKEPAQREFFTIETESGNVFYIVVDKQKEQDNVYLLSAVTESDLMGLAEETKGSNNNLLGLKTETESKIPTLPTQPEITPKEEAQPEPQEKQSGGGMMFFMAIAILAIGGGGYYIKIYKPKKELDNAEDIDDLIYTDEDTIENDEKNTIVTAEYEEKKQLEADDFDYSAEE